MIGPDKELKLLKQSRLMQVSEFSSMVSSLHRFKQDLAVRALTGKKNIRSQQTRDSIFYSVLEKMLLEVSHEPASMSGSTHAAEQQLLALRKVHLWFQSNKHVLVKSDGYFPSARKITEEIYQKQRRGYQKTRRKSFKKTPPVPASLLKNIDGHLKELHALQEDVSSNSDMRSGSSMFAPSLTQDLTSIESVTTRDKEDLDFVRELYDHELMGGNRIERLNRPITAPPRVKPTYPMTGDEAADPYGAEREMNTLYELKPPGRARPQSAIADVKHDLSWAKISPIPLYKLIRKKAAEEAAASSNEKKTIRVVIPSEKTHHQLESARKTDREEVTDPERIANLIRFKEFCIQRGTQQENHMQQYVEHKHGTMQHYLEFPENTTDAVVKKTARQLQRQAEREYTQDLPSAMAAYRDLSLQDFLNKDTKELIGERAGQVAGCGVGDGQDDLLSARGASAPARMRLSHSDSGMLSVTTEDRRSTLSSAAGQRTHGPRPPHGQLRIVQPRKSHVTLSSVYDLADLAGKRMNTANEQTLSAPQLGWKYPTIPVPPSSTDTEDRKAAGGLFLALQDGDAIQHKVLIPFAATDKLPPDLDRQLIDDDILENLETASVLSAPPKATPRSRPRSSRSVSNFIPSRPSTRPLQSPRHVTGVSAVYRQFKTGGRVSQNEGRVESNYMYADESAQRSTCVTRSSRPRTAASWSSYPARPEISRGTGAASHHSTGTLQHRSVAESMRVRSVMKKRRGDRSTSGRSSASSYVAQLRSKQRAGGNLPTFAKQVMKKKPERESQRPVVDVNTSTPQLSFVNIVAPMHVPDDLTTTAYVPPGGVYCGTTAAVAIATDNKGIQFAADFDESELSLEDYQSLAKDRNSDAGSDAGQDNWLSQWLTGGPLDGLQTSTGGRAAATTYADLVSRAAIVDSSDDRSYSEEPSTVGVIIDSSREDAVFSASPRSPPLLSHRTDGTQAEAQAPDLTQVGRDEERTELSLSSHASADGTERDSFGSELSASEGEEEPIGNDKDSARPSDSSEHVEAEESELAAAERVVVGGEGLDEDSAVASDEDDKSTITSQGSLRAIDGEEEVTNSDSNPPVVSDRTLENEEDKAGDDVVADTDSPKEKPGSDEDDEVTPSDSSAHDLEQKAVNKTDASSTQRDDALTHQVFESNKADGVLLSNVTDSTDGNVNEDTETVCQDVLLAKDQTAAAQEDRTSVPVIDSTVAIGIADAEAAPGGSEPRTETGEHSGTQSDSNEGSLKGSSEEEKSGALSARSSVGSLTESESEITTDGCDVRIIVTSAGKVERLLKAAQEKEQMLKIEAKPASSKEIAEHQVDEEASSPNTRSNCSCEKRNQNPQSMETIGEAAEDLDSKEPDDVTAVVDESKSVEVDDLQKQVSAGSEIEVKATSDVESNNNNCATALQKIGDSPEESTTRDVSTVQKKETSSQTGDDGIITYEEVAAVASLSRPASGRPIPDEAEVRDPFLDMVASTRQRQIERGVDIQTIFRGSVSGDAVKKFDLEERHRREVEREAVVKMQRAYRSHLFRVRTARKTSGASPELMEWARSYKANLKEKSERRKQRLHQTRSKTRAAERQEMQRIRNIGPHCGVYEIFHPGPELPDREVIQDAAVEIQRHIRGCLLRKKLQRVQEKVASIEGSLPCVVHDYRELLRRTQVRHGRLTPSLALTYEELESYLVQKKKFELMFHKREFWNEMESSELLSFFNDCNLYPSEQEVDEAWEAIGKSRDLDVKRKKMRSKTAMTLDDVLEVAFHVYVPDGARMSADETRSSTWLNPVVDGVEGLKLTSQENRDEAIEQADMRETGRLVAKTLRERKEQQAED